MVGPAEIINRSYLPSHSLLNLPLFSMKLVVGDELPKTRGKFKVRITPMITGPARSAFGLWRSKKGSKSVCRLNRFRWGLLEVL